MLLSPYALGARDLSSVFGAILKHSVDYADLYFQYSRSEAWSLEEGIVKSGSFSIDQGSGCAPAPARRPPLPIPTTSASRRSAMRRAGAGDFRRRPVGAGAGAAAARSMLSATRSICR